MNAPNSNLRGMEGPQALHLQSAGRALPARGREVRAGEPADPERIFASLRALRPKNVRRVFSKTGPKMAAPIGNRHFDLLYSRLRQQADIK